VVDAPSLYADIVDINGKNAVIADRDGRLSLYINGNKGFQLMSDGFTEQEVVAVARSLAFDHKLGTIETTPPAGATSSVVPARNQSSVNIRLTDPDGATTGSVLIAAQEVVGPYLDFVGLFGGGPVQSIPGGFVANARLGDLDDVEARRILSSLTEVSPSEIPTYSGEPTSSANSTAIATATVAGTEVEVVGTINHPCLQFAAEGHGWCPSDIPAFHGETHLGHGADGKWLLVGLVAGAPARVVVEFSDGTTTDAEVVPAVLPGSVLYGARVPDGSSVRSVTSYDVAGAVIERLGRPPR
jgi:hypothetical protein